MDKFKIDRSPYVYNGQVIYEWDQNLEEVNIYVKPPSGIRARDLIVVFESQKLTVGIQGNPAFIDEPLFSSIVKSESFWTLEDGELHLSMKKMSKAESWLGALARHAAANPEFEAEAKRQMLLQRFQEEHPGFDFSGAEMSGAAPDARSFMGGVNTS